MQAIIDGSRIKRRRQTSSGRRDRRQIGSASKSGLNFPPESTAPPGFARRRSEPSQLSALSHSSRQALFSHLPRPAHCANANTPPSHLPLRPGIKAPLPPEMITLELPFERHLGVFPEITFSSSLPLELEPDLRSAHEGVVQFEYGRLSPGSMPIHGQPPKGCLAGVRSA